MSKKNIAVLGAGKMGLGIAQLFATKGHQVKVIYVYDDKIRCDAAAVVRSNLSVLVENDVMTQQEADDAAARISFVDTIEEVADFADIVFEGIIEKLEIKQDYFAKWMRFSRFQQFLQQIHPRSVSQRLQRNPYTKSVSLVLTTGIRLTLFR